MKSPEVEIGLAGLILGSFRLKDSGIMYTHLLERHCNEVKTVRILTLSAKKRIKWEKYRYIWVTPEIYRQYTSFLKDLDSSNGHFVAIFTSNKKEFAKLKTELNGGEEENGVAKVMYVNRELFHITSHPAG
jgi:hypothetical protein